MGKMGKILLLLLLISTPAMGSEQYFAQVDADGLVLQVVVVNSEVMRDQNGVEQEGLAMTEYPFGYALDEMDIEAFQNMRDWLRKALT